MTRWDDQLANHAIHETLREARSFVETTHENAASGIEVERRRFLKILDQIQTVLEQVDTEVLPFNLLDNLNNGIRHQNVWNQLTAFSSNGEIGHLESANNSVTAQLPTVMQLSTFSKEPQVTKHLKTIEKSVDAFTKSIDQKRTEVADGLEQLDANSSTLDNKLGELSVQVDSKKAEIDQLASGWQKQFSDAQSERTVEYDSWRRESETDLEARVVELIETNSEMLQQANQDFSTEIIDHILDARKKHTEILELHEIVAGDSVAAGYLQNAQDEKKQANFWRWASIVFIVGTAGWTAFSYFKTPIMAPNDLGYWGQALKAFSVAGVLLFGAVYSSKQSNVHRKNENKTRWLALEVKAIDPFIASLSEDDQKALKKTLSDRLFGQSNSSEKHTENAINEHFLETILKSITDVIKAAK